MENWWESALPDPAVPKMVRAIAYYRHSAQDRQENSIPIQQDQVRQWATEHGVEIIHEFADAGKSGLKSEDRPAFTEMMEEWIKKRVRIRGQEPKWWPKQSGASGWGGLVLLREGSNFTRAGGKAGEVVLQPNARLSIRIPANLPYQSARWTSCWR